MTQGLKSESENVTKIEQRCMAQCLTLIEVMSRNSHWTSFPAEDTLSLNTSSGSLLQISFAPNPWERIRPPHRSTTQ